jgi:hypothetical protein
MMRRRQSISKDRASPSWESTVMPAHADALPSLVRPGEPRRQQAVAPSAQDRCDVRAVDDREIGPDACLPYDPRGLIVVAGGWLAFYVIAAIHGFIASGY